MITTEQIKQLRDKTGISIMQCRQALEEAGGDMDKALVLLAKRGGDIANKKAGRTLGAGVIGAYIHGGAIGAMVKLQCETDFVARNPEFKLLAEDIAMHVSAMSPEYVSEKAIPEAVREQAKSAFMEETKGMDKPEEIKNKIIEGKLATFFKERTLLDQPFIKTPEMTVADVVKNGIQKFGENIEIGGFSRISVAG